MLRTYKPGSLEYKRQLQRIDRAGPEPRQRKRRKPSRGLYLTLRKGMRFLRRLRYTDQNRERCSRCNLPLRCA